VALSYACAQRTIAGGDAVAEYWLCGAVQAQFPSSLPLPAGCFAGRGHVGDWFICRSECPPGGAGY